MLLATHSPLTPTLRMSATVRIHLLPSFWCGQGQLARSFPYQHQSIIKYEFFNTKRGKPPLNVHPSYLEEKTPCKGHFICPVLWLQPEACCLRGHMFKEKVGIWKALQFILYTSTYEIHWNVCVTVARMFINVIRNPLYIMWGLLCLLYVWVNSEMLLWEAIMEVEWGWCVVQIISFTAMFRVLWRSWFGK